MQQIADWLKTLGMSEYAQRFAENRIDFSVLPDLTDQDLEKMGVILGDRRKMLRAISSLEGSAKPVPPGRSRRRRSCGARQGSDHWRVRHSLRPQSS
jgi:SAM domain (Sterile alpha motif)